MKRENRKLDCLIAKSLGRQIFKSKLIIIVMLISIFIVGFFANFYQIRQDIDKEVAKKRFGSYQCSFHEITDSIYEELKENTEIDYVIKYSGKQVIRNYYFYGTEEFLENSSYSLKKGRMPIKADEVLCEAYYLYQSGIDFEEDKDIKITLNGTEYTVVGIIDYATVSETMYVYLPIFFFNYDFYEGETFDVIMKTDKEAYGDFFENLAGKYNIDKSHRFYNTEVIEYTKVDENNNDFGLENIFIKAIYAVVFILLLFLVYEVIRIKNYEFKNIGYTLIAQGITQGRILKVYIFVWGMIAAGCILASLLCTLMINFLYVQYIGVDVNIFIPLRYFVIALLFSLIVIFSIGINLKRLLSGNVVMAIKNKDNVVVKKKHYKGSLLKNSKSPFITMARANITMQKGKHMLLMGIICVSMVVIISYMYIMDDMFLRKNMADFDYRINILYQDMTQSFLGTDEMREKYKDMVKRTKEFELYPVFYDIQPIKLNVRDLSEEYIEYLLSVNPDYNRILHNKANATVDESVMFFGADERLLKDLYGYNGKYDELKEDECILVNNVKSHNGTDFSVGMGNGDEIKFKFTDYTDDNNPIDTEVFLKIVDSIDAIPELDIDVYYKPMVIISDKLFAKMNTKGYAELMYVNTLEMTDEEFYEYCKGVSGLKLTNLDEEKAEIRKSQLTYELTAYMLYAMLLGLLGINCFVAMYEKYNNEKRQIAILEAMGISKVKNFFIIAYGIVKLMIQSIFIGVLSSLAVNYGLYLYLRDASSYYIYRVPLHLYLIPVGIIIISFGVVCLIVYKMIGKMKLAETLVT